LSVASVISHGFGSFGTVNLVVTDGYGSGEAPPEPPVVVVGGSAPAGRSTPSRRRRYVMPDGTQILATEIEALELLRTFARKDEPLPQEPKTRSEKRRVRNRQPQSVPAEIEAADIEWRSLPDVAEPLYMPILPPGVRFEPIPEELRARLLALRRRRDEETLLRLIL
jgi:hypothetical protein